MSTTLIKNSTVIFIGKFFLYFAGFYCFTMLIIALSAPGGLYSNVVAEYFDFVAGIKDLLQHSSSLALAMVDVKITNTADYRMYVPNGRSAIIAMSCVGYGVYSVWLAFVLATPASWQKKIVSIIVGLLLLFLINVFRISLLLYTMQHNKKMPLGIDHHTWFNIMAYSCIILLIWSYHTWAGKDKLRKLKA